MAPTTPTADCGLKEAMREVLKWKIIFWTFEAILFIGGIIGIALVLSRY